MKTIKPKFAATLLCLCTLLVPGIACATLGGDASSTQADNLQMKASLRATAGARYTLHEMTLPHGTVVREFVSPQGTVFAVAWKGPVKPDLRQLMGGYFAQYVQAPASAHAGHSAMSIAQANLVVRSSGHLRAFSGVAYLPGALPADVAPQELGQWQTSSAAQ